MMTLVFLLVAIFDLRGKYPTQGGVVFKDVL